MQREITSYLSVAQAAETSPEQPQAAETSPEHMARAQRRDPGRSLGLERARVEEESKGMVVEVPLGGLR